MNYSKLVSRKKLCLLVAATCLATALMTSTLVQRVYAEVSTTEELAKMFEQDQKDRSALDVKDPQPAQWKTMSTHDKEHYNRVLALIQQDKLASGDDFYYAAMIMQHGDKPKDYMLAHILAMAAAQKGKEQAIWLSAASFDRLMQSANQPQVFGTQFYSEAKQPYVVRQPMDLTLIGDSLRKAFHVPTVAENNERLKDLNSRTR